MWECEWDGVNVCRLLAKVIACMCHSLSGVMLCMPASVCGIRECVGDNVYFLTVDPLVLFLNSDTGQNTRN